MPEIPEQLYLTKHPYRQYDTGPKSSKGIYGKKGDHMPSETFFRLPESKQQRIIEAIKEAKELQGGFGGSDDVVVDE